MNLNRQYASLSVKLMEALAQGKDLQTLINIGYEMLKNPIVLVDRSKRAIAITNTPEVEDDVLWCELAKDGFLSYDSINYCAAVGLTEKTYSTKEPFFWNEKNIKYPRIMASVLYNHKKIGGIIVLESKRPFVESDLELVSILCNAISIAMYKTHCLDHNSSYDYQSFITDLLDGNITNPKIINDRMKFLNLKLKKKIFVLAIETVNLMKTHRTFEYFQRSLEEKIPNSKAISYNEHIVLLTGCDNEKKLFELCDERLREYFENCGLKAGLSRSFDDIAGIREHYIQALEAIKCGKRIHTGNTLYNYEDYVVYRLMGICSEHIELEKLIRPEINRLMEYDSSNNTNYTQTLSAYFASSRNLTAAASVLGIHRNTMAYRIDKVGEIMNIDMQDSSALLHLELSFKMLEYNNMLTIS